MRLTSAPSVVYKSTAVHLAHSDFISDSHRAVVSVGCLGESENCVSRSTKGNCRVCLQSGKPNKLNKNVPVFSHTTTHHHHPSTHLAPFIWACVFTAGFVTTHTHTPEGERKKKLPVSKRNDNAMGCARFSSDQHLTDGLTV